MSISIVEIDGIGRVQARLLKDVGIQNTSQLLFAGSEREGRSELASYCGIPECQILQWVLVSDLLRINGVGREYAGLLRAAGVESVAALRECHSTQLHKTLHILNHHRRLVGRTPPLSVVQDWVAQANRLASAVVY